MEQKNKIKIAIIGFGKEGKSSYKFLKKLNTYKNAEFWILDSDKNTKLPKKAIGQLGENYLNNLERFNIIVRSPGVKYFSKEIQKAKKSGVIITSATKLFFEYAKKKTKNIIGVTGTKGKGTTSTLITKILKASGKKVFIAGNIGSPALDFIDKIDEKTFIVLELSSFQLIDCETSPHIAVALMITSEHLNWHKNIQEYHLAKSNITRFQNKEDFAVIAQDYKASLSFEKITKAKIFKYSRQKEVLNGVFVKNGKFYFANKNKKEEICKTDILKIPGEHNFENVGAAITVAKILGVKNKTIENVLSKFRGLEHRLEFVAEKNGVKYYDDSYATTPETSIAAIKAFTEPKILILGGSSKNSDFSELGKLISESKSVKAIIGIGEEWKNIKSNIKNKDIKFIENCNNMEEIVKSAEKNAEKGDVVLLSPACASFGMFKNYSDRGNQFKQIVRNL
jgi:UDP-N-acetylmuramoylalanine--D-glutamate ligase